MTDSDVWTVLAHSRATGDEWKPIPGAGYYEASHRGKVRSVDRTIDGTFYKGKELATRLQHRTGAADVVYRLVNVRDDNRKVWTGTVQQFVLLAHVGPPPPGMEICHGPGGPLDNRWPENIRYGTKAENVADRLAAAPPRPAKEPRLCILCDAPITTGRRCEDCRADLGWQAAEMLRMGIRLSKVAEELEYPSLDGVHELARKYGGYGQSPWQRLRSVINRRKASPRNSDGA